VETIKTAVVVVLLLAVLYGVYVVLNKRDLGSATETEWGSTPTAPPEIDEGTDPDVSTALPGDQQLPGDQRSYVATPLPDMPPSPLLQTDGEKPMGRVTDQEPTLAGPPPGLDGGVTPPPDLSPIPEPSGDPNAAAPEGSQTSLYDKATVHDLPAKGDTGMPADYRGEADQANSFRFEDATKDAVDPQTNRVFQNAWNAAVGHLEKEHWEMALYTLSLRYNDPDVTGEARTRLMDLLDPLAGRVIYSNEHTMDRPYQVRPGDTLQSIADQHQIPMALLQNINGIRDPSALQPGTQLKVLRGPFRAEIDRKQSELVLFLDRNYAGRFAVSVGNDPYPKPAEYVVKAKQPGREYYASDRSRIPAKARDNPYGDWWIGLGRDGVGSDGLVGDGLVGDVCIHGSPEPTPLHTGLGCVSLSSADAADVYHILTVGSKVVIR